MEKHKRIEVLDLTRGVALLGILLMNIRLFSEPYAAYFNPMILASYEGVDKLWWNFQYLVADQKFMAIFSMLFGASTALICDQLTAKQLNVPLVFGRRIAILLMIGLAHSYLIWHGDILVTYALCSIVPFVFRNRVWYELVATGIGLLLLGSVNSLAGFDQIQQLPAHIQQVLANEYWSPTPSALAAEVQAFQGSWYQQLMQRVDMAYHFHTQTFFSWAIWRVSGLMLIGLGLYRLGFLTATWSIQRYYLVAVISLILGFTAVYIGYALNTHNLWTFPASFLKLTLWNYWGSVLVAVGYIALITIVQHQGYLLWLSRKLQSIGRTALSNYLLQSLICTALFYGLGLFSKMAAHQTALIVVMVWCIQILVTHYWLKRNKMGPIELLWRKFTYGKNHQEVRAKSNAA